MRGVLQDFAEGVAWYRLAAEQGNASAQVALGELYADGRGVPQDLVEGHAWLNLAASRLTGEQREGAVTARDRVAERMTRADLSEAQGRASGWNMRHALSVEDLTTGWIDGGLNEFGRNKLVPTISFRLANVSSEQVRTLELNGIFRRCVVSDKSQRIRIPPPPGYDPYPVAETCIGEVEAWGHSYMRAVGREGLEPGQSTGPFTMESSLGYTGEQPRLEMLQHGDFVDAKIELFVKQVAGQWVKLGEHQIERQLLTQ